jgi:hypothetical protein
MCGSAHWRVSARIGQVPALARHLLVPLAPAVRVSWAAQSVSKFDANYEARFADRVRSSTND